MMDGEGRMRTETELFSIQGPSDVILMYERILFRESEGCAVRSVVPVGKSVLVVFEETCLPGPAFSGTGEEIQ